MTLSFIIMFVSGSAKDVDKMAEKLADELGIDITGCGKIHTVEWQSYGCILKHTNSL